eukprot:XP_004916018.1 PREDICTED: UPF0728 protein C10orf53 homolog isoform X1 [Xenopus tropicalis]
MPEKALVTLRFGPYSSSSGLVDHRVSRLQGLRAVLVSDGHQVILEEILDRNTVELIVNGELVFRCNIKELDFDHLVFPKDPTETASSVYHSESEKLLNQIHQDVSHG